MAAGLLNPNLRLAPPLNNRDPTSANKTDVHGADSSVAVRDGSKSALAARNIMATRLRCDAGSVHPWDTLRSTAAASRRALPDLTASDKPTAAVFASLISALTESFLRDAASRAHLAVAARHPLNLWHVLSAKPYVEAVGRALEDRPHSTWELDPSGIVVDIDLLRGVSSSAAAVAADVGDRLGKAFSCILVLGPADFEPPSKGVSVGGSSSSWMPSTRHELAYWLREEIRGKRSSLDHVPQQLQVSAGLLPATGSALTLCLRMRRPT